MGVFRRKDRGRLAETYSYEFQVGGHRFSGNTGARSARDARRVEEERKREAQREVDEAVRNAGSAPWRFETAITAYFQEKLKGSFDATTKATFLWLRREVGDDTLLTDINTALVARLVAKRRLDAGKKPGSRLSNATVNRTVSEPLRRIMRYAAEVHDKPVGKVRWRDVMLREETERSRELSQAEQAALLEALRADYHDIIGFFLITGARLSEVINLSWADINLESGRMTILRKGGRRQTITLPASALTIIRRQAGGHPDAVFTFVAQRSTLNPKTQQRFVKGQRYPIQYQGLRTAFVRAVAKAKIKNYRFHDNRHTAASRILRTSKNLRVVQEILGHRDITTTTRYAHVLDEDMVSAMEGAAGAFNVGPNGAMQKVPRKVPRSAQSSGKRS